MSYSLYGSWTAEEAGDIGKKFKAICHAPFDYLLTKGKEYEITIETRILPLFPMCSFICDNGKRGEGHLERFTKVEAL